MTIVYISRHSQPFRKLLGEYKANEIEQIRNEKNPLSVDGEKYAEQLSDLTDEDWKELGRLEKELERVCKKIFNATMFNFACLMNNAYRDNEKPHVHFHFIPRYKEKVELFGKIYNDKHFGFNFWKWALSRFKRQKDIFTKDEKIKIYEMMKEEFKYE